MNMASSSFTVNSTASRVECLLQPFATTVEVKYRESWMMPPRPSETYWTGSDVFGNPFSVIGWILCVLCIIGNCSQLWWLLGVTERRVGGYGNLIFLASDGLVNLLWSIGFILFEVARTSCESGSKPRNGVCVAAAVISALYLLLSVVVNLILSSSMMCSQYSDIETSDHNEQIECKPSSRVVTRCMNLAAILFATLFVFLLVVSFLAFFICIIVAASTVLIVVVPNSNPTPVTRSLTVGKIMRLSTCKFFDAYGISSDELTNLPSPIPYCIGCLFLTSFVFFVSYKVESFTKYVNGPGRCLQSKIWDVFISLKTLLFLISTAPAVVMWCWWVSKGYDLKHTPGAFTDMVKANEVLQPLYPALSPLVYLLVRVYFYYLRRRTNPTVEEIELQPQPESLERTSILTTEDPELQPLVNETELEVHILIVKIITMIAKDIVFVSVCLWLLEDRDARRCDNKVRNQHRPFRLILISCDYRIPVSSSWFEVVLL